jgi:DNA-binding transcriptional ArsR family regulator
LKASPKLPRGQARLADIDRVFAALANASRRQILLVLHFRGGAMTSSEIAARFSCQWPTTTRHLRRLEEAGLVRAERKGRESLYSLDRERLASVAGEWLAVFAAAETAIV